MSLIEDPDALQAALVPVESTNLQAVAYDESEKDLFVQFNYNSMLYVYHEVPKNLYEGLLSAGSKGTYFHMNIRDRFAYEVVS